MRIRKIQLVSVLLIILAALSTASLAAERPVIISQIQKARPMWGGPFAYGIFRTNTGDREFSIWGNSDFCVLVIFHEELPESYVRGIRKVYDLNKHYNWIVDKPQIGGKSRVVITTFISFSDEARFGKME